MSKRHQYTELPDIEFSSERDAKMREMTEHADRDIAAIRLRTATVHEKDAESNRGPEGPSR